MENENIYERELHGTPSPHVQHDMTVANYYPPLEPFWKYEMERPGLRNPLPSTPYCMKPYMYRDQYISPYHGFQHPDLMEYEGHGQWPNNRNRKIVKSPVSGRQPIPGRKLPITNNQEFVHCNSDPRTPNSDMRVQQYGAEFLPDYCHFRQPPYSAPPPKSHMMWKPFEHYSPQANYGERRCYVPHSDMKYPYSGSFLPVESRKKSHVNKNSRARRRLGYETENPPMQNSGIPCEKNKANFFYGEVDGISDSGRNMASVHGNNPVVEGRSQCSVPINSASNNQQFDNNLLPGGSQVNPGQQNFNENCPVNPTAGETVAANSLTNNGGNFKDDDETINATDLNDLMVKVFGVGLADNNLNEVPLPDASSNTAPESRTGVQNAFANTASTGFEAGATYDSNQMNATNTAEQVPQILMNANHMSQLDAKAFFEIQFTTDGLPCVSLKPKDDEKGKGAEHCNATFQENRTSEFQTVDFPSSSHDGNQNNGCREGDRPEMLNSVWNTQPNTAPFIPFANLMTDPFQDLNFKANDLALPSTQIVPEGNSDGTKNPMYQENSGVQNVNDNYVIQNCTGQLSNNYGNPVFGDILSTFLNSILEVQKAYNEGTKNNKVDIAAAGTCNQSGDVLEIADSHLVDASTQTEEIKPLTRDNSTQATEQVSDLVNSQFNSARISPSNLKCGELNQTTSKTLTCNNNNNNDDDKKYCEALTVTESDEIEQSSEDSRSISQILNSREYDGLLKYSQNKGDAVPNPSVVKVRTKTYYNLPNRSEDEKKRVNKVVEKTVVMCGVNKRQPKGRTPRGQKQSQRLAPQRPKETTKNKISPKRPSKAKFPGPYGSPPAVRVSKASQKNPSKKSKTSGKRTEKATFCEEPTNFGQLETTEMFPQPNPEEENVSKSEEKSEDSSTVRDPIPPFKTNLRSGRDLPKVDDEQQVPSLKRSHRRINTHYTLRKFL